MNLNEILVKLLDLGDIGTFISAIAAIWAARSAQAAKRELKPNHGSSVADKINALTDSVRSLGHQIGEVRRAADITHEDLSARVREVEKTTRHCRHR